MLVVKFPSRQSGVDSTSTYRPVLVAICILGRLAVADRGRSSSCLSLLRGLLGLLGVFFASYLIVYGERSLAVFSSDHGAERVDEWMTPSRSIEIGLDGVCDSCSFG